MGGRGGLVVEVNIVGEGIFEGLWEGERCGKVGELTSPKFDY